MRGLWGLALVTGRGVTASRNVFDRVVAKLEEKKEQNEQAKETNENNCKKYECEVQKDIDEASEAIPRLEGEIDETKANLDSLRSSVTQLSKEIKALRQDIADANTKLDEETASRNDESAQNANELAYAEETVGALEDALSAVQQKNDDMTTAKMFLELSSKLKHMSQHKAQITALLQQGTGSGEEKMVKILRTTLDEFLAKKDTVVAAEAESLKTFTELKQALEDAIAVATDSEAVKSEQKSADSQAASTAMSELEGLRASLEEKRNKLETATIKMESNKKYCAHVSREAAKIITQIQEAITLFNNPEVVSKGAASAGNFLQINLASNKREGSAMHNALQSILDEIDTVLVTNAQRKKEDERRLKQCAEFLASNLKQNVKQVVEKRTLESEVESLTSDIEGNTQSIEQSTVDLSDAKNAVVRNKKERMGAEGEKEMAIFNAKETHTVLQQALGILGVVSEPDEGQNKMAENLEKAGKGTDEQAADTNTDSIKEGSSQIITLIETIIAEVEQEKETAVAGHDTAIEEATTAIKDGEKAISELKAAIAEAEDLRAKQMATRAGKAQRLELVGEDFDNLQRWWGDDNPGNEEDTEGQKCLKFTGQATDYGKLEGRERAFDSDGYVVPNKASAGGEFATNRAELDTEEQNMNESRDAVVAAMQHVETSSEKPQFL